jgi:hypothetical protein
MLFFIILRLFLFKAGEFLRGRVWRVPANFDLPPPPKPSLFKPWEGFFGGKGLPDLPRLDKWVGKSVRFPSLKKGRLSPALSFLFKLFKGEKRFSNFLSYQSLPNLSVETVKVKKFSIFTLLFESITLIQKELAQSIVMLP